MGGSGAGAISHSGYMETAHKQFLNASGGHILFAGSITSVMNTALSVGANPFTGVSAYDPTADMDVMTIDVNNLRTLINALNYSIDVPGAIAFAKANVVVDVAVLDVASLDTVTLDSATLSVDVIDTATLDTAILDVATLDTAILVTDIVDVEASSAGSAKVHAVKEITAHANSAGTIRFRGNPERSDTNSSSGGSVKKSS